VDRRPTARLRAGPVRVRRQDGSACIGRRHVPAAIDPQCVAAVLAQQAAAFLSCRVILVPGNHEYYRGSFDGDRAALLAAEIPGVTVLDRGEARIGALRVLGATLWTDYAVTGDPRRQWPRPRAQSTITG
jgi:hypothetical protein